MAAWHPPRCDWTAASGRLPGRVHFSIQSPHLQIPRQTVLSIGSTSRAGRPHPVCRLGQTTTCCVWWRQVNTPIFLLTIPESVLGMVLGEFVLEGWLKDIAAKAVVLAIEAVRNASCCGWEMAIPAPRAARIRGGWPAGGAIHRAERLAPY